jgi:hypothetical protein
MEYEPDFFDEDENRVEPWRIGALGGSRTHDLWLRRPTLYPTELRAHNLKGESERFLNSVKTLAFSGDCRTL